MRKRIGKAIAAMAVAAGLVVGVAPPASAAQAWVYVVVNDRVCGIPLAKVKAVQGNFNWGSGSSTINWDYGDNIVYPRVDTGKQVTYQINVACYVGTRLVGYGARQGSFIPSYHQQTIWVG
jgi:hypothetical protein